MSGLDGLGWPAEVSQRQAIRGVICELLVGLRCPIDMIQEDAWLTDDLGLDDLDRVELAMMIDEHYGCSLDDGLEDSWVTVANVVECVQRTISGPDSAPEPPEPLRRDPPVFAARYISRDPDPGVCRVISLDWDTQRAVVSNGPHTYFPSFDEIDVWVEGDNRTADAYRAFPCTGP